MEYPSWILFIWSFLGNVVCFLPFIFANYDKVYGDSMISRVLGDNSVLTALLCSMVVSVPILIDLCLDYAILSQKSHETYHWISRFILILSLAVPNTIMWACFQQQADHSPHGDNVVIYSVMVTFRLMCMVLAVLYYLTSTNLQNSIFNLRNSTIIMAIFVNYRFFAVLASLYPDQAHFLQISAVSILAGLGLVAFCAVYWAVNQHMLRRSDIRNRASNVACSQIYLFSCLAEGITLIAITMMTDGSGNILRRSAASLEATFFVQISLTVVVTLIPGRYAKQESLAQLKETAGRQAFVRYLTDEVRVPLQTIRDGLRNLNEQTVASDKGDNSGTMMAGNGGAGVDGEGDEHLATLKELQSTCDEALSLLHRMSREHLQTGSGAYGNSSGGTFSMMGSSSGSGGGGKPSLMLDVAATRAVPFILSTIKKCSVHAQISGNSFLYDIGTNELQDSVAFTYRDVYLFVDAVRMERVVVTFISNAIQYARSRSEIKFKLDLLEDYNPTVPSAAPSRGSNSNSDSDENLHSRSGGDDEDGAGDGEEGRQSDDSGDSGKHRSKGALKKKLNRRNSKSTNKNWRRGSESEGGVGGTTTAMLRLSILFGSSLTDIDHIYHDILQFKLAQIDGGTADSGSSAADRDDTDSGLGLYIAKQIIELHGGTIGFSADPINTSGPFNTVFYVDLPYSRLSQESMQHMQSRLASSSLLAAAAKTLGKPIFQLRTQVGVAYDARTDTYKQTVPAGELPSPKAPARKMVTIASGAQRNRVFAAPEPSGGDSSGSRLLDINSDGEQIGKRKAANKSHRLKPPGRRKQGAAHPVSDHNGGTSLPMLKPRRSGFETTLFCVEEDDGEEKMVGSGGDGSTGSSSRKMASNNSNSNVASDLVFPPMQHVVRVKPGSAGSGKLAGKRGSSGGGGGGLLGRRGTASVAPFPVTVNSSSSVAISLAPVAQFGSPVAVQRVLLVTDNAMSVAEDTLSSDAGTVGLYFAGRMGSHTLVGHLDTAAIANRAAVLAATRSMGGTSFSEMMSDLGGKLTPGGSRPSSPRNNSATPGTGPSSGLLASSWSPHRKLKPAPGMHQQPAVHTPMAPIQEISGSSSTSFSGEAAGSDRHAAPSVPNARHTNRDCPLHSNDIIVLDSGAVSSSFSGFGDGGDQVSVLCRRLREDIGYTGVILIADSHSHLPPGEGLAPAVDTELSSSSSALFADGVIPGDFAIEQLLTGYRSALECNLLRDRAAAAVAPGNVITKSNSLSSSSSSSSGFGGGFGGGGGGDSKDNVSASVPSAYHGTALAAIAEQPTTPPLVDTRSLYDLTSFSYLANKSTPRFGGVPASNSSNNNNNSSNRSGNKSPSSVRSLGAAAVLPGPLPVVTLDFTEAPRRVLVVDDSAVARKMLRRRLEDLGFLCDEVEDGEDAVAVVERSLMRPADNYVRHHHIPKTPHAEAVSATMLRMHPVKQMSATGAFTSTPRSSKTHRSQVQRALVGKHGALSTEGSNVSRSSSRSRSSSASSPMAVSGGTPRHAVSSARINTGLAAIVAPDGVALPVSDKSQPLKPCDSPAASVAAVPLSTIDSAASVASAASTQVVGAGGDGPDGSGSVSGTIASAAAGAGLESCLFYTYDVVMMDFEMPSMNGVTATRLLRDMGYAGAVIGVTDHTMPSVAAHFIAAGADDVLTKPLDMRLFMATYKAISMKEVDSDSDAGGGEEEGEYREGEDGGEGRLGGQNASHVGGGEEGDEVLALAAAVVSPPRMKINNIPSCIDTGPFPSPSSQRAASAPAPAPQSLLRDSFEKATAPTTTSTTAVYRGLRALIIDPTNLTCKLAARSLGKLGFHCDEVGSIAEGADFVERLVFKQQLSGSQLELAMQSQAGGGGVKGVKVARQYNHQQNSTDNSLQCEGGSGDDYNSCADLPSRSYRGAAASIMNPFGGGGGPGGGLGSGRESFMSYNSAAMMGASPATGLHHHHHHAFLQSDVLGAGLHDQLSALLSSSAGKEPAVSVTATTVDPVSRMFDLILVDAAALSTPGLYTEVLQIREVGFEGVLLFVTPASAVLRADEQALLFDCGVSGVASKPLDAEKLRAALGGLLDTTVTAPPPPAAADVGLASAAVTPSAGEGGGGAIT